MTNAQIHSFRDFKFCDGHFHYSFPETLHTMEHILDEFFTYFPLNRVGLMALSRTDKRPFDPTAKVAYEDAEKLLGL